MMRIVALIACVAVMCAWPMPRDAEADDGVQMLACIAKVGAAGREDPAMDSPLFRWPDGRLRTLEKGDTAYTGREKGRPLAQWIELYGALQGHGSSLPGFFRGKHFDCRPVAN